MSEYLLLRYRPIADQILSTHELIVDDETRDMLAKTIMFNRTLPFEAAAPKYTPMPALKVAKTHAIALLKFATAPPTRLKSVELRSRKLASALRDNDLVGMALVLAKPSFNPLALLDALDKSSAKPAELRRLMATINAIQSWKVGRPGSNLTKIVRAGCIAWQRAGHEIKSKWSVDNETLSGALPNYLRDLIACCSGKHELIASIERPRPHGASLHRVSNEHLRKGDKLVSRDLALRDAINCYRAWCKVNKQKIVPFSLDSAGPNS